LKILTIALLGAGLLASGAAVAKQPAHHSPANANQYYGLYQGSSISQGPSLGFAYSPQDTSHDYPSDGLHPTPQQRASYWHP
jgi:hypothetical protein